MSEVPPRVSKHGGSPSLGTALSAPVGDVKLAPGSSVILEPEVSEELRQRAARKMQFERRRVALELLPSMLATVDREATEAGNFQPVVAMALACASELIAQTGGES